MVSMVTRNFGVRRCAKTKTVVGLHVLSALVTLRIYVVLNLSNAKHPQISDPDTQPSTSSPSLEARALGPLLPTKS